MKKEKRILKKNFKKEKRISGGRVDIFFFFDRSSIKMVILYRSLLGHPPANGEGWNRYEWL